VAEAAERHPLRESLWVRLLRVLESAGSATRRKRPARTGTGQIHVQLTIIDRPAADAFLDEPKRRRAHNA
jgi:hypothetical protein